MATSVAPESISETQLRTPFTLDVEPGAHSGLVVWQNRTSWLDALAYYLTLPQGVDLRKSWKVSVEKVMAVAFADASVASSSNGRDVLTSHATVARKTGLSVAVVRRARGFLEKAEFAKTLIRGRYLSGKERQAAFALGNGRQRRVASTRALALPRFLNTPEHMKHWLKEKVEAVKPKRRTYKKASPAAKKWVRELGEREEQFATKGSLNTLARRLETKLPNFAEWSISDVLDTIERQAYETGKRAGDNDEARQAMEKNFLGRFLNGRAVQRIHRLATYLSVQDSTFKRTGKMPAADERTEFALQQARARRKHAANLARIEAHNAEKAALADAAYEKFKQDRKTALRAARLAKMQEAREQRAERRARSEALLAESLLIV